MRVRRATAADAAACADIYRPYVLDTAITFETDVPAAAEMAERIVKALAMHEWLVLEAEGNVVGYAYAQQFNPRAAYRWAVETSIYLAQDGRRAGGGRLLYTELLHRLAERGFRQAFAGIAQPNEASNALHSAFGFAPAGYYRRVGWKLDAWHDVEWWQLDLLGPDAEAAPPRPIAT
ncbi:MAG: GNAT family N-acetyltransferase [Actinomycetota bacterium]|uniref:GNAT family N-acetyltransferase n=1 Tax=Mycobacterium lentiflavum TaxID=141349 RepID=A0ABY3V260_MYCLN|nr:GNAT family N-acetyltransferase [Mycobacterium lentiflavum]MEE3066967.1 GNAT family N-acetyltransferase [Actinomycetota bacterium]ULP43738.1 GNAT family N-acetyltransferase [Mycobacterium lentiflavum]